MTTQPSDLENLTILGKESKPSKKLEAFPNKNSERYYLVTLETSEFTCVCPLTGQPDFATIHVSYVPDQKIVESKSFKLYLWSYREEGAFHEHVINKMLDDLVEALDPHWIKVIGVFNCAAELVLKWKLNIPKHWKLGSSGIKIMNQPKEKKYSIWFIIVTALFVTSLITANIIAVKLVGIRKSYFSCCSDYFPIELYFWGRANRGLRIQKC